jgi:hypothetical protein
VYEKVVVQFKSYLNKPQSLRRALRGEIFTLERASLEIGAQLNCTKILQDECVVSETYHGNLIEIRRQRGMRT